MACKQIILETMVSPEMIPGDWVTLPKDVETAISAQSVATNKELHPAYGWWGEIQKGYVDKAGDYWAVVEEVPYSISGVSEGAPPLMKKTSVYHCLQSTLAPGQSARIGGAWAPAILGSVVVSGMLYWLLK
jgi:hypothetical protein